jgi:CheY-like chemotaxis protein
VNLDGACVLLLEDEFLVALDAEEILKELGARQVELAESLRARGIPVVFVTGYELKDRAIPQVDTALCVSKPYTSDRLRQVLCAAMVGSK